MSKFKTLRHIETVRNYIGFVVTVLLMKAEKHDQSKLQPPEAEIFGKVHTETKRKHIWIRRIQGNNERNEGCYRSP